VKVAEQKISILETVFDEVCSYGGGSSSHCSEGGHDRLDGKLNWIPNAAHSTRQKGHHTSFSTSLMLCMKNH
jgi:hypothetical protein